MPIVHLHTVDYMILASYLAFVLGIGWVLRKSVNTGDEFFLSGRRIPTWIAALAFLSANLGAQEVIGMGASGAEYGVLTCQFYWLPAVTAMVFVGVFMMPFYYGSKARSVPEFLKLRFDEKTRGLNAFTFATMTIFSSGISMFALAKLLQLMLGWNFNFCIWLSAAIVLVYVFLGGLTSAIYNEVLQFFLIVMGFIPLTYLGLKSMGGWAGLKHRLSEVAVSQGFAPNTLTTVWSPLKSPSDNPMGVEWMGMLMGLGFVLAYGYWCTDFLVIQRAMAAKSMSAARRTPLIATIPKMLFPLLVILPGMVAISLSYSLRGGFLPKSANGSLDYNMATPLMLAHFYPSGLLGLGFTALLASFMSGMAGNVTAFNTVWTYDIYQSYIRPNQSDHHYLRMGHIATVAGILLSICAAYAAAKFNNIMDLLQLVFAFVNAPLFATFLLGMFWKRTTGHAAFFGLLAGTLAAMIHHGLTVPLGATTWLKGAWLGCALHTYPSQMAQSFWTAIWAWSVCFIATIIISLLTVRHKSDAELSGLVYSLTPQQADPETRCWLRPGTLGAVLVAVVIVLNIIFW